MVIWYLDEDVSVGKGQRSVMHTGEKGANSFLHSTSTWRADGRRGMQRCIPVYKEHRFTVREIKVKYPTERWFGFSKKVAFKTEEREE